MSGDSDDEFDRIVEGLEFDLEDLEDEPTAPPGHYAEDDDLADESDDDAVPGSDHGLPPELDWFDDEGGYEDPADFYEPPTEPIDLGLNLGWAGALGIPLLMTLSTISGIILPRPVVVAFGLLFVAAVLYLFSRIPRERRGGDGDDGAVV